MWKGDRINVLVVFLDKMIVRDEVREWFVDIGGGDLREGCMIWDYRGIEFMGNDKFMVWVWL